MIYSRLKALLPFILPAVLVCAIVLVMIFQAQSVARDAEAIQARCVSSQLTKQISDSTSSVFLALRGTQAFLSQSAGVTGAQFDGYVSSLAESVPGLRRVLRTDQNDRLVHVYPQAKDFVADLPVKEVVGRDTSRVIGRARYSSQISVSAPYRDVEGEEIFDAVLPVFNQNVYMGSLIAVIRMSDLTSDVAAGLEGSGFAAVLSVGDQNVPLAGKSVYGSREYRQPLRVGDSDWEIVVSATRSWLRGFTISVTAVGLTLAIIIIILLLVLLRERDRLSAVVRRESEFVSLVSHQLRLPLSQARWATESLLDEKDLSEDALIIVRGAHEAVTGAAGLVSDLLDVSRLERGVTKLSVEDVSVADLMRDCLAPFSSAESHPGTELEVSAMPQMLVRADRQKAIEAIRNIVDNAFKYGRDGGRVIVSALETDGHCEISVTDFGAGIPAGVGDSIFDKATAFSAKKIGGQGAGLGLYLTKQFLKLMGGEVSYASTPGKTVFTVSLPKA